MFAAIRRDGNFAVHWRILTNVCPKFALFHRPDWDWVTPMSAKEASESILNLTYCKVLAETGNEREALFEAERAVRRAQGSSAKTDLYNKQILVDYFKGKRSGADPEVEQQFQRLREQAEIDWKEMYAGKNSRATPENMAEDYIDNAKATANTQRLFTKMKLIGNPVTRWFGGDRLGLRIGSPNIQVGRDRILRDFRERSFVRPTVPRRKVCVSATQYRRVVRSRSRYLAAKAGAGGKKISSPNFTRISDRPSGANCALRP
jgi:hypothetical protein